MDLFILKFDPNISKIKRDKEINQCNNFLNKYIKDVVQIVDDQVLRRLLSIVLSCVRTNVFIKDADQPLSFKFQCDQIFGMQTPILFRETFVFDYFAQIFNY